MLPYEKSTSKHILTSSQWLIMQNDPFVSLYIYYIWHASRHTTMIALLKKEKMSSIKNYRLPPNDQDNLD